ncbi:MAG: hypothetical protein HMLIMOIP_002666 [Candidatus Nitrosomirales archaeon]|jgi:hypothetical protein
MKPLQISISEATDRRLKRIQELKKCDEQTAIEYAISVAWLVAENRAMKGRISETIKSMKENEIVLLIPQTPIKEGE